MDSILFVRIMPVKKKKNSMSVSGPGQRRSAKERKRDAFQRALSMFWSLDGRGRGNLGEIFVCAPGQLRQSAEGSKLETKKERHTRMGYQPLNPLTVYEGQC